MRSEQTKSTAALMRLADVHGALCAVCMCVCETVCVMEWDKMGWINRTVSVLLFILLSFVRAQHSTCVHPFPHTFGYTLARLTFSAHLHRW